jgi:ABC-type uncharacterized transport system permease subunit
MLWILQGLLAALFLFGGVAKLMMSGAVLSHQTGLPGSFMRFISIAELAGGIGLILPSALRVTIMIGAVVMSLKTGVADAIMPFVTGLLLLFVAYGRWRLVPIQSKEAR